MVFDVSRRKRKARRAAPASGPVASQPLHADGQHHLIALQRQIGNTAVTRLLQRAPRDRPASTDAPWAPKRPKSKPKPPAAKLPDIHARVIKYEIDQGKTLITIASGPDQGVQVGMSGSLVQSNGREVADFTIESANGRVSKAHTDAIPDQVIASRQVVIKASKFEPQSMEGKEF
jgi:hypothetical protein